MTETSFDIQPKVAAKLSLINVRDYPGSAYTAAWEIFVDQVSSAARSVPGRMQGGAFVPTGPAEILPETWEWKVRVYKRADHPSLLDDGSPVIDRFGRMVFARTPEVLAEVAGTADSEEDARRASQEWVLAEMKKYKRGN